MGEKGGDSRHFFWRILYRTQGARLTRRFCYTCEPIEIEGPFLLISNHVTNNDPFFVGLSNPHRPLTFVASEHIFRLGFASKLIKKLLAPIPRSKAASGAGTVKSCLRSLKNGEAVALFAEGDCTWSGLSAKVFPATGKLAKAAGAPLVTYRIEGGYLSRPRWSKHDRKGKMHGGPVRVYTPEELKAMTPEEVTAAIDRDIFVDAWAAQTASPVKFVGKSKAEGLERGFYICPRCGGMRLASHGDDFRCPDCGCRGSVSELGGVEIEEPEKLLAPVGNFADWEVFQTERMAGMVSGAVPEPAHEPVPCLFTEVGEGRSKPEKVLLSLSISDRTISFGGNDIPLADISDMSMVKTDRLLFTHGEGYYELKCKTGCLRSVLNAWQAVKRAIEEEKV